jgi:AcrR family transcriptional regulator
MPAERTYGGKRAQERREQRRQQLIEAGLDVIGEVGVSGLTMTLVIRRAELTERYFYESFSDRNALLVAIFAAGAATLQQRILTAVDSVGRDVEARARATATTLVSVLTEDPRMARLFIESVGSDVLRPHRAMVMRFYAAYHVEDMLSLYRLEGRAIRARLNVASRMIVGGLAEALGAWLDGSGSESPEVIIDACVQLTVANIAALAAEAKRRPKRSGARRSSAGQ